MELLLENWREYLSELERPTGGHNQTKYEKNTNPPPIAFDGFAKATYDATGESGGFLEEVEELTESQLLTEGRIQDAERKFPELAEKREELDGESLLDVLIQGDPSENQKYLMGAARILKNTIDGHIKRGKEPFWGKQWPEDEEIDPEKIDKLISPWGIAMNITGQLETFHLLQKYVESERRDINRIKDFGELNSTVNAAVTKQASVESEKDRKQQEKVKAKEGSRVVDENDSYVMIRPETTEASCYYGKGTKWCISASESSNYFDEYSAEGKTFYFVFLANLSNDNKYKKIALEMEPGGAFNRAWNAWDEPMDFEETTQGIVQNLLNQKVTDGAVLWYQHITGGHMVNREDVSKEDVMEFAAAVKELGVDYNTDIEINSEPEDYDTIDQQREESVEAIETRAMSTLRYIIDVAQEDAQENPSIPKEPYYEMMERYQNEVEHLEFELKFPDETGESHIELNSYIWINIPTILARHRKTMEWTVPWEEPETLKQINAIIRDAITPTGMNIYDLEYLPDDVRGQGPYFKGVVDYSHIEDLDELRVYLNEMLRIDESFSAKGYSAISKALIDAGLVAQEGHEAKYWQDPDEIEKQGELALQEAYKRWAQLIK